MKLSKILFCVLLFNFSGISSASSNQSIKFELTDVGILTHSKHGKGIVMIIKPDRLPKEGIRGEEITREMHPVCNHYAPAIVPKILKQIDRSTIDYIGVRVISGGMVGLYIFEAYALDGETCGHALN